MKKYKVQIGSYPKAEIKLVECERETKTSVWIGSRRSAKRSYWENYFDTWEQAHDALVHAAEKKLQAARKSLSSAQETMADVICMVKPEDTP